MIYLARHQAEFRSLGVLEIEPNFRRLTADDFSFAILYRTFRKRPLDDKLYEVDPHEFAEMVNELRGKKNLPSLE